MKALKFLVIASISIILTGCGTYTYNNEKFNTPADAYARQENLMQSYMVKIDPLTTPLSTKKLIVGIPNSDRILSTIQGGGPAAKQYVSNIMENEYLLFYKAAKKRNIYTEVELVRTDGGDLIPSDNKDIFYLLVTDNNQAAQWYLASTKSGKQAVSIDLGLTEYTDKVHSLVTQIESFAIQNSQ